MIGLAKCTQPTVLVVDDFDATADLIAQMLEEQGFCASTAYDGVRGLTLAQQLHPATVILDIDMPGMSGLEVCRRIRREPWGTATRIIVMSGWTRLADLEAAKNAGCDTYLMKPANLATIIGAIGRQDSSMH